MAGGDRKKSPLFEWPLRGRTVRKILATMERLKPVHDFASALGVTLKRFVAMTEALAEDPEAAGFKKRHERAAEAIREVMGGQEEEEGNDKSKEKKKKE